MLSGIFGGSTSAAAQQSGENKSLLADWNSYANTRDIEAGTTSTTENLFQSVDRAGAKVGNFIQNSVQSVRQGVASGVSSLPTSLPSMEGFR
jgi:hypothetical protein